MEQIEDSRLFEFFLETLGHCGTHLLQASILDIEWHLFEEFDSGSIPFLHKNTLDRLLNAQYISAEVYTLCELLRKKFRGMEGRSLWNADSVKSDPEWHTILSLSDKIKGMINRV